MKRLWTEGKKPSQAYFFLPLGEGLQRWRETAFSSRFEAAPTAEAAQLLRKIRRGRVATVRPLSRQLVAIVPCLFSVSGVTFQHGADVHHACQDLPNARFYVANFIVLPARIA
jgi:hypothetical protein